MQKQQAEIKWLEEVDRISKGRFVTIPWVKEATVGKDGLQRLKGETIQ
ncbi:hypothetical protein [Solibacillus cecembensis]